jgi:hypothetical protein
MNVLVVVYEFRRSILGYEKFIDVLKSQDGWSRYMIAPCWLVKTSKSPDELYQELAPHMLDGDRVLIMKASKEYAGFMPLPAWEWLNGNLETAQ